MESNESPLNIFRKSAKKGAEKEPATPSIDSRILQTRTMMEKMKDIRTSIDTEMGKLIEISGFTEQEVWGFLENSHNLTPEQLEKSEADYNALKEQVRSSIVILPSEPTDQPQAPSKEHRKTKFSGARRHWLSTH